MSSDSEVKQELMSDSALKAVTSILKSLKGLPNATKRVVLSSVREMLTLDDATPTDTALATMGDSELLSLRNMGGRPLES